MGTQQRPLFAQFPALKNRLPFMALADLPTPLQRLDRLSDSVGAEIWVKRDGLTHAVYGGNKIRKFEFVFADLLRRGARAVITGGGLGSHHTLATAVMAQRLGIRPVLSHYCQPVDDAVRRNLLRSAALGVDAHYCGDYVGLTASFLAQYIRWFARSRRPPYFVYPGASNPLGISGYVNASLEIQGQLSAGRTGTAPEGFDAVFVAVGSCGTYAGMLLGARLGGIAARIVGVQVTAPDVVNAPKLARLATRTARFLRRLDPAVPDVKVEAGEVELWSGYLGPGYAHATPEARQAVATLARTEGLPLETTYTGKAMAALLDHARSSPGSRLLFVDTYSEASALPLGDPSRLPARFGPVFNPDSDVRCWCLRAWREPGFCWRRHG